jgi:hypothetical protein
MLSRKIDWARLAIWLLIAEFCLFVYWGKMPSGALEGETFKSVPKEAGLPE